MRRPTINLLVDILAFLGFFLLAVTGVLMRYTLPPGTGGTRSVWGLDRHEWGDLHFWISVGLLGILVIHLVLHARWIVCMLKGRPREDSAGRFAFGLVGTLALAALLIAPLVSPVDVSPGGGGGRSHRETAVSESDEHGAEDESIRGSMTLAEVAESTGVPVRHLLVSLKLREDTPHDEKLGRLAREHGFSVSEVRTMVQEYRSNR